MKISVVMACYNGSRFIEKQLDSIKTQTYMINECIIIDDCSEDDTYNVVDDYIRKNKCTTWKLLKNDANRGYIATFKKAMGMSNGEIVFLADQDDIWDKSKIEIMSRIMESRDEILSLCASFSGIDDCGNNLYVRNPIFTENHGLIMLRRMKKGNIYKISLSEIAGRNISMGCTMAVRKCLIETCSQLDDNNVVPHDWLLNFGAALNNGLFFLNTELIKYRIHSNNTIGIPVNNRIGVRYRIREYETYTSCFREFERALDKVQINSKCKRNIIKRIKNLDFFYQKRIEILSSGKILNVLKVVFSYLFRLGPESVLAVMDAISILREHE